MSLLGLLFNAFAGSKSSSEMSDRELQRKLDRGVGRNTGEDVATRASYLREAERRDIKSNQK